MGRQIDVDLLGPEVPRNVDLGGSGAAHGVLDHPVQDLRDPGRIAHLLLVADHLLEERHLLDFLEAALADGLVAAWGVTRSIGVWFQYAVLTGVTRLRDPGTVLADAHRDLAGGAGVAVAHETGVALVGDVPESDAGLREEVRDRHEGGADDAEDVLDAVPLEDLHEGFFSRHSHGVSPPKVPFPGRARVRPPLAADVITLVSRSSGPRPRFYRRRGGPVSGCRRRWLASRTQTGSPTSATGSFAATRQRNSSPARFPLRTRGSRRTLNGEPVKPSPAR